MTASKIMIIRHAEKPDDAGTVFGVTIEGTKIQRNSPFAVGSVREPWLHSSHPQMPTSEISASRSRSRSLQVALSPTVRVYAPNIL
jgi:hypothetical protein